MMVKTTVRAYFAMLLMLAAPMSSALALECLIDVHEDKVKQGNCSRAEISGGTVFHRQWRPSITTGKRNEFASFYNANSCAACHINNGRGRPPLNNVYDPSFLMRISIPPQNEKERMALALEEYATVAEPRYGRQLQNKGIDGGEGNVRVEYRDKHYELDDGDTVILHRPVYSVEDLKYGKLHKNVQVSARIAQPLHRIGLLGAISNADILSKADPNDSDKDGISGRANLVRDIASGKIVLGRFGWKATQPNLLQQTAAAFAQDIGITSIFFGDVAIGCVTDKGPCVATTAGQGPDSAVGIQDIELNSTVVFVSRIPAFQHTRQNKKASIIAGEKLFSEIGCISCHRKSYKIEINDEEGKLNSQTIYPYSDLLLHDMGAALADHRPVAQASGWEWRTQPLWGIGKAEAINGNKFFLHDGRARTITEAILWHGGEARKSRKKFAALNKQQRAALVEFVEGL